MLFRSLSSTSYGTFQEDLQRDEARAFGGILAPFVTLLYGDDVTRPLSAILRQTTGTDKFTQELRLSSPDAETFEWMVGGYYTREQSRIDPQDFFAVEAGTDTIATDVPKLVEVSLRSEFEEYAGFANVTWHITPRFDVTAGGRSSHNRQWADQFIDATAILGGEPDAPPRASSDESVTTWSLAPRFDLSDNASIYARVATGYRPGGPNVLPNDAPPGTPRTYD